MFLALLQDYQEQKGLSKQSKTKKSNSFYSVLRFILLILKLPDQNNKKINVLPKENKLT